MIRIHFTADDLVRVRFAPRPSPVPELHAALIMLGAAHEALLFGRWRSRLLRNLPGRAEPLADLTPDGVAPAPAFLQDRPDRPVALAYPAGRGLPLVPAESRACDDPLG
ncbi:hypothetical protein [Streptomyces sp. JB150]|uniref:hypothetical protein n=1 Tax=Streptomyces sp. JB150 TaxID=2714844 RepID=UPI003211F250